MRLQLSGNKVGGIVILRLKGHLTLGPSLRELQSHADHALADSDCSGFVLSVAGVTAMDSAGIGELVMIHSAASRRGMRVVLAEASSRLIEMLAVTRVDGLFGFAPSEFSAVQDLHSRVRRSRNPKFRTIRNSEFGCTPRFAAADL